MLGTAILSFEIIVYGAALVLTDEVRARTLAFIGLIVANLSLIFVSRSRSNGLGHRDLYKAGRRHLRFRSAVVGRNGGGGGECRSARPLLRPTAETTGSNVNE